MAVQMKPEDLLLLSILRTKACTNFTHSCLICTTKKAFQSTKVTQLFKLVPNSKAWRSKKSSWWEPFFNHCSFPNPYRLLGIKHMQYSNIFPQHSTLHVYMHAHKAKKIIPKRIQLK